MPHDKKLVCVRRRRARGNKVLGILDDPQNRVTNILCRSRKGDIGDEPIVWNHNNKPTAGIESGYASIYQAKGVGREATISGVKSSAVDKEKNRSFSSMGGNGIINIKLVGKHVPVSIGMQ
jgi:hypothetical protein